MGNKASKVLNNESADLVMKLHGVDSRVHSNSPLPEIRCLEKPSHPSDFEPLCVLGKGSFGKVYLVKRKGTDMLFAMKTLDKSFLVEHHEVRHTLDERLILASLRNPFLVRLDYAFQTEQKLYLVMEYVPGGELFYHISRSGPYSEETTRVWISELVCALEYLHSKDVLYRDLKLENILLDEQGHLVLTDFGLSKPDLKTRGAQSFVGTAEYIAPELLKDESYGKPVDWWGLGAVMYELLTGLPPFYVDGDVDRIYWRTLSEEVSIPEKISSEAADLLRGLLTKNPKKRLGTKEGASVIKNHPWFSDICWTKVYCRQYKPPVVPVLHNFDPKRPTYVEEVFLHEKPQSISFNEDAKAIHLEKLKEKRKKRMEKHNESEATVDVQQEHSIRRSALSSESVLDGDFSEHSEDAPDSTRGVCPKRVMEESMSESLFAGFTFCGEVNDDDLENRDIVLSQEPIPDLGDHEEFANGGIFGSVSSYLQ